MPSPDWNDDDELMRDIGKAAAAAVVDDRTLMAGRLAFGWLTVDTALARLAYDSALAEPASVRGPAGERRRTMHFTSGNLAVEIELSGTGIEGQLIPPGPGQITVQAPHGTVASVAADEFGYFRSPPPPPGPLRLECSLASGTFVTEWTIA